MLRKKECIAMLLAGGQGSRLSVLTKNVAKPAVPFGGKYRIIDFPLSNCINSGIDTVGVLTQYQPLELHSYIGNGQPWDLDRAHGGCAILPPYMTSTRGDWYKGTANAVYQNINFIDRYDPEYVLILSGDHVYKMNYEWMLKDHKKNKADCTIAVINVSLQEASRFGIMNTNPDGSIYEFEEKPKEPKSTKASMGVYIFSWKMLRKYLIEDDANPDSSNDFGKNIIPRMLEDGCKMFAYEYLGYWKDVGTIESLWDSNMDALHPESGLKLQDPAWRIYARNPIQPPQYVAPGAVVSETMIAEGSEVYGNVYNSIIFYGVKIGKGAKISNSIIMPGTVIGDGAQIEYSIVAENVVVGANAHIGESPENGADKKITVIGSMLNICDNANVEAGSIVEDDICQNEVRI